MRISTSHLQQLTIFTTILTGGGIGTMYCLLQKLKLFASLRLHAGEPVLTVVRDFNDSETRRGVIGKSGLPELNLNEKFAESDYHRLALQELEACPLAMESLGAPPLKVHNIHLTDRYNRVDQHTAQIKIPVTGSKTGGILYTSSLIDPKTNRWNLKQAVLNLWEGQTIDLLNPPSAQTHAAGHTAL